MLIVVRVVPVGDPLPDVPSHILHSVGGISIGKRSDSMQGMFIIPFSIKVGPLGSGWFIPPGVEATVSPASSLLPFCFRRQPFLSPTTISLGVVPGRLHDG